MQEPQQPTDDKHITVSGNNTRGYSTRPPTPLIIIPLSLWSSKQISAPFEIGISMTEEDYDEYGVVLQEIIQRLLGGTEAAGLPDTYFIRQNLCSLRLMYIKENTLKISYF